MSAPRVVVIEGDIAAGKSVLLAELAAALRAKGLTVAEVPEPVDTWVRLGALQQFYSDPTFAYRFQTLVYATRVLAYSRALDDARARGERPDVLLAERSPATDALFAALADFSPVERAMYALWCDAFLEMSEVGRLLPSATAVYLRPTAAVCEARCASRARDGEQRIDPEYRRRLRAAHDAFLLADGASHASDALNVDIPRAPYGRVLLVEGDRPAAEIAAELGAEIAAELGSRASEPLAAAAEAATRAAVLARAVSDDRGEASGPESVAELLKMVGVLNSAKTASAILECAPAELRRYAIRARHAATAVAVSLTIPANETNVERLEAAAEDFANAMSASAGE